MTMTRLAGECVHATARVEEAAAARAEFLSLSEQELVVAVFWWL
jgi:rhamnose utilization protein RhaD (predicted bifunctional aldolase and dehydrogenase)